MSSYTVVPLYNATLTKGHPSYQARYRIYWDHGNISPTWEATSLIRPDIRYTEMVKYYQGTTSLGRPSLLSGHIFIAQGVALKEGDCCIINTNNLDWFFWKREKNWHTRLKKKPLFRNKEFEIGIDSFVQCKVWY